MNALDVLVGILLVAGLGYIGFYIYVVAKGVLDGVLNIKKESKVLSPSPLSDCPAGLELSGALCYKKCDKGGNTSFWNRIAATCWLKDVGVGGLSLPGKKPCDSGQRDDGTSCWEDWGCRTWCDGGKDLFGNCYAWNLKTECKGCGCIKKTAFDRYDCGSNKDLVGAFCYDKCPDGMEHIPGVPTKCRPVGISELSYTPTNDPGVPMTCPPGKVKDGALCYDDPGPDWKVIAGVAWKNCPSGSKDIGAFCVPGQPDLPWYLTYYMLAAAILAVGGALIYFRVRSIQSSMNVLTSAAGGRRRKTKKVGK